ncbi:MAG: DPP IV N-terminal domain-containing protein [Candidatus Poribacteria bacterium]|nr:DPP IV N-terminal domain-containing protein [Candidatus Poribacteria bacterium]
MKRTCTYVVLGMAFLLNSSLFVSNGWAIERDVISFVTREDRRSIQLINTRGELFQTLTVEESIGHLTWAPDGHSLAYMSNRNGDPDIYVMDVRTNTHRRLTFDDGRDWWPSWSPNGKWIAFASNRAGEIDLYRMDANGKNVMRLTNQGKCKRPAWSPDSRWIAFISKSSLFVMTAEGKGRRQLADTFSTGCAWSPDGKEIAFVPRGDAVGGKALFSVDKDGKNMRQLTRLYKGLVSIFDPTWSPSGKWIAYLLVQPPEKLLERKVVMAEEFFANSVICIANTADGDGDGGDPIEATRELVSDGPEWVPEGFLSVSPSSEKQTTLWGRLKQIDK